MSTKSNLFFRNLYYSFSPNNRLLVRKLVYFPSDFINSFSSKNKDSIPKKGDIFIGSGDFVKQGKHQLELLKHYVDIQADGKILDVGSGIGRTAFALKSYLDENALYDGFDVVEKGVTWCQKNISNQHSNFNFKYTPLHNDLYHLASGKAEKFVFPYQSDFYDTVFLFSVFTHMQPLEVQNYLNEIYRVLKPGGKCLATFFYYTSVNEDYISSQNGEFIFPFKKGNYRVMNEKVPSANIAFEENKLKEMFASAGLQLSATIDGYWKEQYSDGQLRDFQDVFILEKK
jgi:SAM-dependent methyltransferase